jgi:protein-S-isoprenylcysteine O-methyltransferase Ste14
LSRHEHSHGIGAEHPRSHEIQLFCVVIFTIVWIIDSFLLHLTTQLSSEIPLLLRLLIFIILVLIGYRLALGSHKLVLNDIDHSEPKVVANDVYALLRHPMYFAYFLGSIALIQLTMSLISFIPFIITVFLFNKIAVYEENELIKILDQEYLDYMKNVPRWVPKPFKFLRK